MCALEVSEMSEIKVNVIMDGELKQVSLHPCVICEYAPSDLDSSGKQVHLRKINGKYICEACAMRVADAFGLLQVSQPIAEISFGEFTVYTTERIDRAIDEAINWYTSRYDDPLEEPVVRVVGTSIYTSDPRDIVIPGEEEE